MTKKTRLWLKPFIAVPIILVLAFVLCGETNLFGSNKVAADENNTINLQAKLNLASGAMAPNGTYNIEFKLYNSADGGQPLWTEDYLNSNNQGVNVSDSYFSVQLGSIVAFPSNINWSQPLWVSMNIGGSGSSASWDGEMNPRLQLTAVPYAFQANQLAQETNNNLSTLGWANQTASNNIFIPDESGTLCVSGDSTDCGFAPGNSNSYIQNSGSPQSGATFNIGGSGTIGGNLIFSGSSSSIIGGTGGLNITSPSGNLNISSADGNISLNASSNVSISSASNGRISIGDVSSADNIVIGQSNSSQTIAIANGNGTSTVDIASNSTNGNTVDISSEDSGSVDTINIGTGSTSISDGKVINIGTGNPTGNGSNEINIGNMATSSTTDLNGGTISLQTSSNTLDVTNTGVGIDNGSNAPSADLSFGGNESRSINVLQSTTGNGGDLSISAGSGAGPGDNGGDLVLQAGQAGGSGGSSGSVIVRSNGTESSSQPTFIIQNSNSDNLLSAFTGVGLVSIGIGTPTLPSSGFGDLFVAGSGEFGLALRVGNGLNGINFTVGQAPSSTNPFYEGSNRPVKTISEAPVFNGLTVSSNSNGDLSTGTDMSTPGSIHNYYNWTTTQQTPQSETLYVQIPVPNDFSGFTSGDQICYNVYTDDSSGISSLDTTFYDTAGNAQPEFNATPTVANSWQQECTTDIGGTMTVNGNSFVTVVFNITAATNKNVRIGSFSFNYLSAF